MADADRLVAALNYLQEQKPADPLESFRSLAGLKDAYERRVQPIINNAMQTFSTGGAMGDLLRSYGDAAAPGNAAALQGMGIPFKGPMTAPREEGFSSGENFRPMGDPQQQFAGQLLGDPMNVAQPAGARLANALKFAKPDAMKMVKDLSMGAISPMDTWHGSPHRFPPTAKNPLGEFDPTKIGTGEGAQAYGHGLYLAENPKVAKEYMSAGLDEAGFKKHFSAIVPKLDEIMSPIDPLWKHRSVESKTDSLWKAFSANEYGAMDLLDGMSKNEAMAARIVAKENRPFSMYKVDLPDEHIAKMLDWDKPLSQQPTILKTVNDFLASKEVGRYTGTSPLSGSFYYKHGPAAIPIGPGNDLQDAISKLTGNKAYDLFKLLGNDSVSSAYLKDAGIPGIRYLDQGSRAGGAGTSNFVVFDPAHMNIIGRE